MQTSPNSRSHPVSATTELSRLVACAHLTDVRAARWLDQSARARGMNITAIRVKQWRGFHDKVIYLRRFLSDLPQDSIVLYLDAYDVLINRSAEDIWRIYHDMGEGVIFSGELNAYPARYRVAYLEHFNPLPTNYRFLNSGSFMGPRDRLIEILDHLPEDDLHRICHEGSDQAYYAEYYLQHRFSHSDLKIDHYCRLFQNFYHAPWHRFRIEDGLIINDEFGHAPCVLHFSGRSYLDSQQNNVMPELTRRMLARETHDPMWHVPPLYRPLRQKPDSVDPSTGLAHPDEMTESHLRDYMIRNT
jgi:hypothetical protein